MALVDSHVHLGSCRVFDSDQSEEMVLQAMDRHAIEASVVQPFPGAPDPHEVHDRIAALGREHPGRIFGMASLDPHQDGGAYRAEVERCVKVLGFVAVKLHALGHAVNPRTRAARLVFETAAELEIPVMVHTGHGVPFAEPAAWLPLAREFADTTVVLGHAGAPGFTNVAVIAAEIADNIVLETSWCSPHDLGRAVRTVGADRVMFGSDLHFNAGLELAKYAALELPQAERDMCLGNTAVRVFGLSLGAPAPASSESSV